MADIRIATETDTEPVLDLVQHAFNFSTSDRERARERFDPSEVRVAEIDGRVVGTVRRWPFAHYFGGRAIPAVGIAGVAVAPEVRGRGLGAEMMTEALREMRAAGITLSSLYPATVPLYRASGYGFGGIRAAWKIKQESLPQHRTLDVEPFSADQLDEVNACYERIATASNGLLQRHDRWWRERVWEPRDNKQRYRYLVREEGIVTGYVDYSLNMAKDDWRSDMECRDLLWTTPGSARALLSLASLHRSTGGWLRWNGGAVEPLGDLVPEDTAEMEWAFRWMLRLVDVPGAIEARGYHPLIEAAVSVKVTDPMFPENEGPWRIEVSGGSAKALPTGTADATITIQGLAALFSSLHRTSDLRRTGAIEASEHAAAALDLIFGGPTPWLADFF